MKNKYIILFLIPLLFTSCASFVLSKKQTVKISTLSEDAHIYMDNIEISEGETVTKIIKKNGPKEIIVTAPGYKDKHAVIIQSRRPIAYYFLQPLNLPFFLFGSYAYDAASPKNLNFEKKNVFTPDVELTLKDSTKKYIQISNIQLSLLDQQKDLIFLNVEHANTEKKLLQNIKNAESLYSSYQSMYYYNSKIKSSLKYEDTKYSIDIYRRLRKSGFVDTINKIFKDNNNTLILEGKINKVTLIKISGKKTKSQSVAFNDNYYYRAKLNINWYIKNNYNDVIDSIETNNYSDDFLASTNIDEIFSDAIENSYLKLHEKEEFKNLLKIEKTLKISDNILTLEKPKSPISNKIDAFIASVIVKNKNGHGSGFAITNDGYIITNYHVISTKKLDSYDSIEIITSDGETYNATVVRVNRYRDIALLKIEKSFEKSFELNNNKSFNLLEDIYTIGSPKSTELGQSVTYGLLSNERIVNNNHLLQLAMSVNGGNSGGPVFDENGKLQGVVVQKLVGNNREGVCFAIPGFLIEDYLNINYK